jgi:hypothetical protein
MKNPVWPWATCQKKTEGGNLVVEREKKQQHRQCTTVMYVKQNPKDDIVRSLGLQLKKLDTSIVPKKGRQEGLVRPMCMFFLIVATSTGCDTFGYYNNECCFSTYHRKICAKGI